MKAAILGLAGHRLTTQEAALLTTHQPLGCILFARNIADPAQLASLTAEIRAALPPGALLMVDQEGGRVARLRRPHWREHPPARAIGNLYSARPQAGLRAAWITGALIGLQCRHAGFDVVAAPVLDVASPDGHDVIGDRAFSADPDAVGRLGGAFAAGLLAAGIQPIGKHAPGHGRARADSHLSLPVLPDISDADLAPFIHNAHLPWMMTAHISYAAQDPDHPATQSPRILADILRGKIGFTGLLISDDLAMQALVGPPSLRATRALQAGCDVALHCSGIVAENAEWLAAAPELTDLAIARLQVAADAALAARQTLDADTLDAERAALLDGAAA